jgi:predicted Zn-dependent protease
MKYLILITALILVTGCSVNPVTGKQDFVLISETQEIQMGREYNSQVLKQFPVYQDEELQDYVQEIGESLAEKSHRPNLIYRFTVLDSPDINAFALPGGYIYINRGLMSYLSNEEELAAVLGHEIGHVTARHSVRQYSQSQLMGVLSAAVEINAGSTAGNLANLASGAILSGYGREMELEADDLGAQYIHQDGYSPQGMYEVLSVLKDQEIYSKQIAEQRGQEPRSYHGVFASHPSNDLRLQEVLNNVSVSFKQGIRKQQDTYLEKIEGMVFGDSEQSGVRRGSKFYHGPLNLYLAAPDSWEIINTPSALIFSSSYGEAFLQMTLEDLNFKETPEEYIKRFATNISSEKTLNINGFEGFSATTKRSGRTARMAAIFKGNQVYQFIGYMKNESLNFQKFDLDFLKIINSFRTLEDEEIALSKPLRIRAYKVRKGDTYSKLSLRSSINVNAEDQLRLINGDYPDKPLSEGRIIKVVE